MKHRIVYAYTRYFVAQIVHVNVREILHLQPLKSAWSVLQLRTTALFCTTGIYKCVQPGSLSLHKKNLLICAARSITLHNQGTVGYTTLNSQDLQLDLESRVLYRQDLPLSTDRIRNSVYTCRKFCQQIVKITLHIYIRVHGFLHLHIIYAFWIVQKVPSPSEYFPL